MIVVNFSHPLSDENIQYLEKKANQKIDRLLEYQVNFDTQRDFVPQVIELMDSVDINPREWQTEQIFINLPAFNYIAAIMLAELDGRTGHLPSIIRIHEVKGAIPIKYEIAEIPDLQETRNVARSKRWK